MKLFLLESIVYKYALLIVLLSIFLLENCNAKLGASQFSIMKYGAVGDGKTMNTSSIQSAIDACTLSGGGIVIIPKGTFLTGTIIIKNHVEINLMKNAILLGSENQADYPSQPIPQYRSFYDTGGFNALIYAEGAKDIAITGRGIIDAQGQLQKKLKDIPQGMKDDRPRTILFISCIDVTVAGIKMQNSGFWNQHYLNCEDVLLDKITVFNHANSNNDALDIDGCRRVIVSNCNFDSADDALVLKSTGKALCEDIIITNCILSSFTNAIKAGTESTGGFRNINISNCIIKPSKYKGKRIYSFEDEPENGYTAISLIIVDGGIMEGVNINNITIEGTQAPIFIRLGNRGRKHIPEALKVQIGRIENISISNLVAYGVGTWTSSILGMNGYPIKNISLSNIQFLTEGGILEGKYNYFVKEDDKGYPEPISVPLPAIGMYIRHVEDITINNIKIGVKHKDDRVPIWVEDVNKIFIKNIMLSGKIQSNSFIRGIDISNYNIEKPLGWTKEGKHILLD